MPKNSKPMSILRTACSFLGVIEPEDENNTQKTQLTVALRLLAIYGPILNYWY